MFLQLAHLRVFQIYFTKSRSIVIPWQPFDNWLSIQTIHPFNGCQHFLCQEQIIFQVFLYNETTLWQLEKLSSHSPCKRMSTVFLQRVKSLFYFYFADNPLTLKGYFCVPFTWLDQFNQCQTRSNKDGSWQIGPLTDLAPFGLRKGAGSFQIHRKTKKELWHTTSNAHLVEHIRQNDGSGCIQHIWL